MENTGILNVYENKMTYTYEIVFKDREEFYDEDNPQRNWLIKFNGIVSEGVYELSRNWFYCPTRTDLPDGSCHIKLSEIECYAEMPR